MFTRKSVQERWQNAPRKWWISKLIREWMDLGQESKITIWHSFSVEEMTCQYHNSNVRHTLFNEWIEDHGITGYPIILIWHLQTMLLWGSLKNELYTYIKKTLKFVRLKTENPTKHRFIEWKITSQLIVIGKNSS